MKRGHKTGTIEVVSKALQEVGPMTLAEMMDYTGFTKSACSHALRDLNKMLPTLPKRAHITQWVYDHEGQKRYPRAVYAWGNYPDAAKPERDPRANQKRSRDKKRLLSAVNSVFNLGRLSRGGYTRQRRVSSDKSVQMARRPAPQHLCN